MSVYAQVVDFEDATGIPVPPERSHVVQELLDEAELVLASIVGDLAERIESELTTALRLRTAVVSMVRAQLRSEESRAALLRGSTTYEERNSIRAALRVGRRERYLAGIPSSGWSLSAADSDLSLARPQRPAPPPRGGSRIWR